MRRARLFVGCLVLVASVANVGCTTAIKRVYYEIRGAKSEVLTIRDAPPSVIARYNDVSINRATTELGSELCPPGVLRAWRSLSGPARAELKRYFPGEPPTIAIDAEIIYFQAQGILSEAQLITRVRMRDAESERILLDGLVRTESKSFREGDEEDLVESNLGALQEYLIEAKAPPEDEED